MAVSINLKPKFRSAFDNVNREKRSELDPFLPVGKALACPYALYDTAKYASCRGVRIFDQQTALKHLLEGPHLFSRNVSIQSRYTQRPRRTIIRESISQRQVDQIKNLPVITKISTKKGHTSPLHEWWFTVYKIIFPDHPLPLDPYAVGGEVSGLIGFLQSTTEHILSDRASLLQKAIQKHTGSQHELVARVAEQRIRAFVRGWIGLISRSERNELEIEVPAPEWQDIIMSISPNSSSATETVFRPFVSDFGKRQSDIDKNKKTIDSGVSGRSIHPSAQKNTSTGEVDNDSKRVATALEYIDIHQREIDRILESRPDLRSLHLSLSNDIATEHDNSDSAESEGRSLGLPGFVFNKGAHGDELATRRTASAEAHPVNLLQVPHVTLRHYNAAKSLETEEIDENASPVEAHASYGTGHSRTFSSLGLSDTEDTDDADDNSSCADLSWFSPGMPVYVEYSLLHLERPAIEEIIKAYQAWKLRGETAASADSTTSHISSSQNKSSDHNGKRKLDDSQLNEEEEQGLQVVKKRRKEVLDGQARLACHFQKRFPEPNAACGILKRGFTTVAQIKQHFWRCHVRNPNYCPVCKSTFRTEEAKNEHIMQVRTNPCVESSAPLPEGLSHSLVETLKRRVDKESDLTSQWFSIWDLVFPGVARPRTCTFDLCNDIPVQAFDLASFIEAEGPRIILSGLENQGFAVVPSDGQDVSPDVDAFLRRTLTAALQDGTQEWLAQRQTRGSGANAAVAITASTDLAEQSVEPRTPEITTLHNINPLPFTFDMGADDFLSDPWPMSNNMPHNFGLEMDSMRDLGGTEMSQAVLGETAHTPGSPATCFPLYKNDHTRELPLQFELGEE